MKSLLLLLWLFLSFSVFSQQPGFRNFTVDDGLLSSECYQVLQDKQNNIWIATDKGVNRFDGARFYTYTKRNGLPENCVLRMHLDSKGRIWFVTLSAKMAIYENGKMRPLPVNKIIEKKIGKPIINSMAMYRDTLRLGYSFTDKALKITYKSGKFHVISHKAGLKFGSYVELLPNGETSFGTIINGYHGRNGTSLNFFVNKMHKEEKNFFLSNNEWFYTEYFGNKFYVIQDEQLKIFSLRDNLNFEKQFDFRPLKIKLEKLKKGHVTWVCTTNGLLKYTNDLLTDQPKKYLEGIGITDFFRDKEGGVWLTTLGSGIYYARNTEVLNARSENAIASVLKYKGQFLLGTNNGRLNVFNGSVLKKSKVEFNYPIQRMFHVNTDCFFAQTDIVNVFSIKRNWATRWKHMVIEAYVADSSTHQGFICFQGCVFQFDLSEIKLVKDCPQIFQNMKARKYSKLYNRAYCAIVYGKNKLLLGTNAGLIEYDTSTRRFKKLSRSFENLLTITAKGKSVWLGYKEDGIQLRRKNKIFRITTENGLTSDYCRHIFLEDEATAWISTNRGLTLVKVISWSPFKYKCFRFTQQNGLVCNELIEINKWNDKIVVVGNKGLSMFDPSTVFVPDYQPEINVIDVSINEKQVPLRSYYYAQKPIKNLLVNYQGICFRKGSNLLYRYRLKGVDDWKIITNALIEYNGIPYGENVLEIQAQSTNGYWNSPIRRIVFYSPTPFFETWWFRTLFVLLLGLVVWLIVSWRIRLIKQRATDREQLYRKASEMELKFLTAQMNPHFTFNAMNSIQHFMLENDLLKAQNYLTKYSKLIRFVLESNMQEYVNLSSELEFLKLYVDIEAMRLTKSIEFIVEGDRDLLETCKIPSMLIQPYVENAIWHGLLDESIQKGVIRVTLREENGKLLCIVEDNGIGRERAQIKKQKQKSGKSFGMLITQKRLDQFRYENASAPEIIDLYDSEGKAAGTKVILYLPYKIRQY